MANVLYLFYMYCVLCKLVDIGKSLAQTTLIFRPKTDAKSLTGLRRVFTVFTTYIIHCILGNA